MSDFDPRLALAKRRDDLSSLFFCDRSPGHRTCKEAVIRYSSLSGSLRLLVISMAGTKNTKQNVIRTGIFSANLVSTEMLPLMDYLGSKHGKNGRKDDMTYGVSRGEVLDIPTLDASPWVYECEVARAIETGDSTTFFCHIRNIQMDERLECEDIFDIDLTVLDPVIYSGKYHSIGKLLGKIGEIPADYQTAYKETESIMDKELLKQLKKKAKAGKLMLDE